jgi:hypothetical protein
MKPYPAEVEMQMRAWYATLTEREQRRYTAIEAVKLGHGGQSYIARVLGCSRNTVRAGIKELTDLSEASPRIRRPGGGRKSYAEQYPALEAHFEAVLADYTAGDPMEEQIRWTNLSLRAIAARITARSGIHVSTFVIRQLLDKQGYRRRKAQKKLP